MLEIMSPFFSPEQPDVPACRQEHQTERAAGAGARLSDGDLGTCQGARAWQSRSHGGCCVSAGLEKDCAELPPCQLLMRGAVLG